MAQAAQSGLSGLPPLEYSDCYLDSPKFREVITLYEKEMESIHNLVENLVRECGTMIQATKEFSETQRTFADHLSSFKFQTIGEQSEDERMVVNSLQTFATLLLHIEDYRQNMLSTISMRLLQILDIFRKEGLKKAMDGKKPFDQASEKYYDNLQKYMGIGAKKKNLLEADYAIERERTQFRQAAFEYACKVQDVNAQKQYEIIEPIIGCVGDMTTFLHEAYDAAMSTKDELKDVQLNTQILREMHERENEKAYQLKAKIIEEGDAGLVLHPKFLKQGHVFVQDTSKKKAHSWHRYFCQFRKEEIAGKKVKLVRLIPVGHQGLIPSHDFMEVKHCIRCKQSEVDRRFCFDIELATQKGTQNYLIQAQSEEDRKYWLEIMEGKEPIYSSLKVIELTAVNEQGYKFIKQCIREIECRGLEKIGIYHKPGIFSKATKLYKDAIEMGKLDLSNEDKVDTETIASAVKGYLSKELKEPLMTFALHGQFIGCAKIYDHERRLEALRVLVDQLPEINRRVLVMIIEHLHRIAQNSKVNMMNPGNLGVIFGAALMRAEVETVASIVDLKYQNIIVKEMIKEKDRVFYGIQSPPAASDDLHTNKRSPEPHESSSLLESETPKKFVLPELSAPTGYQCVAQSALGLVYLSSSSNRTVSIEPVTDAKLFPNLESNEILLTTVVSLSPQQVPLDPNQPAIIELTKSVEPTDLNYRQLVPIRSHADPFQWEELAAHHCKMLPDRIRLKITQFGYLSVKARFPFPSGSTTVDPGMQHQAEIEIQELPGFKIEVPPASVQSATKITATVLYDNPQVTEQFKLSSLASACVRLEPHIQFEDEVKITLPILNYDRVKQKHLNAKLEVWLSKSTDEGVPTSWEPANFTTYIDENGNCLATACITHFSTLVAFWNGVVDFVVNFFTKQVHGHCQVFMSAEKRMESFLTFGVTVLLHPFNMLCQGVPNYPYLLFDSVVPIDVAVGDVECQLDLNDAILRTYSINQEQKSHKESASMSRDCNMRADFNMELQSDAKSSELPAGTTVATLFIKHGSEKQRSHKFTLIKPLESGVDRAKERLPSLKGAVKRPLESSNSVDLVKAHLLEAMEKAAQGLKKTTKEMEQQNVLTLSARRIARHMQKVKELASNSSGCTEGNKITDIVQLIIEGSEEIKNFSEQLAQACTQLILRKNLLAEIVKIPGVLQPLKFSLRTIKRKQYGEAATQEAIELLTTNAANLQSIVEAVLKAADTAIIQVPKSELGKLAIKENLGINDLHQVQEATWAVRAKWYNCGLALGVSSTTLDAIEESNHGKVDHCYTETLKEWLKGAGEPPTWSALCIALESPSVGYI